MGIANLSGSIVAMLLMDKLGRKILLSGSFLGMAFAMGLQAVGANRHHLGSASVYLSVGGMLLFVLTFSLGAGPVPGLLLPEIFPNKIRAKAMALCMSVHWVVNFFVSLLFLRLLEQLGPQKFRFSKHNKGFFFLRLLGIRRSPTLVQGSSQTCTCDRQEKLKLGYW
ncbi:hypothetical protein GUJ93_ZPchr0006g41712 [Zizania palustris]|uniref:Major facilitator superfamily (MFS) profile domain-containing protein n=1 Tax=Zizania palustris TaxID=103762 RepID=A0A8J5VH92_ZIZPA|nr:hypothetical protein GUJ93_ZPchr0006g41712 [Zizania palustris]